MFASIRIQLLDLVSQMSFTELVVTYVVLAGFFCFLAMRNLRD